MSKAGAGFIFIAGVAIGAAGAWYYTKDKYARIAEEEIASVKAAYAAKQEPVTVQQDERVLLNPTKVPDKASIVEYANRVAEAGYTEYSRTMNAQKNIGALPYVISPDEFGEIENYTKVSLTYFEEDGVLSDELGEVVDDEEEIVGDALDHFGDYEEDSVFVRSDAKRCDYEILKDLGSFSEFRKKNFPPDHDEEV